MKTAKILISFILILTVAFSALLSGCGAKDDDADKQADGTAANISAVPADSVPATDAPSDTAETEAPYVNPVEGLETVGEDLKVALDESGLSMREYKLLKANLYTDAAGKEYNWFEFYNACIRGELKLTDPAVVEFAQSLIEDFENQDLPLEKEQAETLINAAKGLNG